MKGGNGEVSRILFAFECQGNADTQMKYNANSLYRPIGRWILCFNPAKGMNTGIGANWDLDFMTFCLS